MPKELWNRMIHLDPSASGSPSIEMLREYYVQFRDCEESQFTRDAFRCAIIDWSDDEVREFVCKWLLEPPHSEEMAARQSSELREFLNIVYRFVFEGRTIDELRSVPQESS